MIAALIYIAMIVAVVVFLAAIVAKGINEAVSAANDVFDGGENDDTV